MSIENIPLTPGQKVILKTIKDDLLPKIDNLKKLLVKIQSLRVSYQLYSPKLKNFEKEYSEVIKSFFETIEKLETPDLLFKDSGADPSNMIAYFQFQIAFK